MLRSIILWSEQEFANWFNNRCSKYGFIDGGDYTKILVQCIRGQNEYDYALTIDCAKELSTVENQDYQVFTHFGENPKGGCPSIEYALTVNRFD